MVNVLPISTGTDFNVHTQFRLYSHIGQDQHSFALFVLFINFNICFWCLKEPSYGDGSFESMRRFF